MPVLRMQDNSMSEALSSLASQLANNFSPKTRAEAYLLQQRIFLEQLQVEEKRKQMAAVQAATAAFGRLVDNDPNKVSIIASHLLHGGSAEDALKLAIKLTPEKWMDADTPEAWKHNMARLAQANIPWDKPYPPAVGPVSAKAQADMIAAQEEQKSRATEGGKLKAGEEQRGRYQYVDDPSPAGRKANLDKWYMTHSEPPPSGVVDAGPATRQYIDSRALGLSEAEALAKARGETLGRPQEGKFIDPNLLPRAPTAPDPITGVLAQPQTAGGAPAMPPGAKPTAGGGWTVTRASPLPGTYAQPIPETTYTPGVGTRITEGPGEATARAERDKQEQARFGKYADAEKSMAELDDRVSQAILLTQYRNLSKTAPDQANNVVARLLAEHKIYVSNDAMARDALNHLLQSELPELVREANARFAGPEIKPLTAITGDADQPASVLLSNLARQQTYAQRALESAREASRVLGRYGPGDTMRPEDFDTRESNRWKTIKEDVAKKQAELGGIGAPGTETGPRATPSGPPGSSTAPATAAPGVSPQQPPITPAPAAPATDQAPQAPAQAPASKPSWILVPGGPGGQPIYVPAPVAPGG
jgi:hypothetical protein